VNHLKSILSALKAFQLSHVNQAYVNWNYVDFFVCEPIYFGSPNFGLQKSDSQQFGSQVIWIFFMVNIFP
jgi:hypothetical protein